MNLDKIWQEPPFRFTPLQNFINGCLAAGVAQTLSYPFETVKRKMQVISHKKTSACSIMEKWHQKRGMEMYWYICSIHVVLWIRVAWDFYSGITILSIYTIIRIIIIISINDPKRGENSIF